MKKIKLKPFKFETGQAKSMLDIFEELYPPGEKIRHVFWVSQNRILIEKTVTTKDVNEFILEEPNKIDRSLIDAFRETYKEIKFFFVNSIDIDEDKSF